MTDAIETFIARWQSAGGSERANYQLFITELCVLLELPTPDPARDDARDNAYVFERRVIFRHGDGGSVFDDSLLRARIQPGRFGHAKQTHPDFRLRSCPVTP